MTTPVIDLSYCEFDKTRKRLSLASEYFGMPSEFDVVSNHTGRKVRFKPVQPEDRLFDQDQWDGEQQIYRPTDSLPNVEYLVIYHQY
jgi:hypothetical protein